MFARLPLRQQRSSMATLANTFLRRKERNEDMTNARGEYRFKTGKFAGKTMEHVMLRYASDLYWTVGWARDQPHLRRLVNEFDYLREKLSNARIMVRCSKHGCERTPIRMTLPLTPDSIYLPAPFFWCRKHEPSVGGISEMMPISFDEIESFDRKRTRKAVHRSVLNALGIKKRRRRITETFAHKFFANLD